MAQALTPKGVANAINKGLQGLFDDPTYRDGKMAELSELFLDLAMAMEEEGKTTDRYRAFLGDISNELDELCNEEN